MEVENAEKIPRSRSRSKAIRRKDAMIQFIRLMVIITFLGLFLWSLFYMIIGNNLHGDRRNNTDLINQILIKKHNSILPIN
jgi:ABC-type antimicrobial peptide transport system permease subunit